MIRKETYPDRSWRMTFQELADYIWKHKFVDPGISSRDDDFVIYVHVRTVLYNHVHITNEHIDECCEKATNYEEFIELCRPIAIADEAEWKRKWNAPPGRGRTRRRFR